MSAVALQDRALMDRSRAMKMAATTGNGDDAKDRIEESIAQDSADGNDSCYFFQSLIFPVFCGCSHVPNLQAPKGLWTASKAFKLLPPTGHYRRNCYQALHVPKGMYGEIRACPMDPMKVLPAGRR